MNRVFTIPNILSMIRIALIPVIIIEIVLGNFIAAAVIILISFITDVADGYIARRFNMISNLGKMLDPFADKLTQGAIGFSLCYHYPIMIPMVILLVLKELTMLLVGLVILKRTGKPFSAHWWGKVSTGTFYAAVFLICAFNSILPPLVISIFVWITFAALLFSMIMYIRLYFRFLHHEEEII